MYIDLRLLYFVGNRSRANPDPAKIDSGKDDRQDDRADFIYLGTPLPVFGLLLFVGKYVNKKSHQNCKKHECNYHCQNFDAPTTLPSLFSPM